MPGVIEALLYSSAVEGSGTGEFLDFDSFFALKLKLSNVHCKF